MVPPCGIVVGLKLPTGDPGVLLNMTSGGENDAGGGVD